MPDTPWTNDSENTTSWTNPDSENATDWDNDEELGSPWAYNEPTYTYNQVLDPVINVPILYNSVGVKTAWVNPDTLP